MAGGGEVYWFAAFVQAWYSTCTEPLTFHTNNISHLVTMHRSVKKPWILAFMWMRLDRHHPVPYHFRPSILLDWQLHSTKAVTPTAGQCTLPHCRDRSGMVQGTWQRPLGVGLVFKFPRSQSDQASVGCPSTKSNPWRPRFVTRTQKSDRRVQWFQKPQDTPKGPVFLPQWIRAYSDPRSGVYRSELF